MPKKALKTPSLWDTCKMAHFTLWLSSYFSVWENKIPIWDTSLDSTGVVDNLSGWSIICIINVCTWLKELPLIRLMNADAVLLSIAPRSARITCAQQATLHISMETDLTNEHVVNAVGQLRKTAQVCSPPYRQDRTLVRQESRYSQRANTISPNEHQFFI